MNTNEQKNARCENCKWFNPTLDGEGECRASPPVGGVKPWQRWFEVKTDDWCRVFTTKPDTP